MTTAKVGQRYQVVIPRKERELIGLKPHSEVDIEVRGDHLIVRPKSDAAKLRGIGSQLRDGVDAADYVRELRAEWGHRD